MPVRLPPAPMSALASVVVILRSQPRDSIDQQNVGWNAASLLPLWEKVARIARCETDEGSVSADRDPSSAFPSGRHLLPQGEKEEGDQRALRKVRLIRWRPKTACSPSE